MRIFVCLCLVSLAVARKTFFGDEVLTLHPTNSHQANLIKGLNDVAERVDFWNPGYPSSVTPNHPVDIRIPSGILSSMKKLFTDNGINFQVKIDDLQALIDNQFSNTKGLLNAHSYDTYNTYDTIANWAYQISSENPSIAFTTSIGKSFEGRNIPMITISTNSNNPEMLVDCGFHAREWISPAFCQCYTQYLIDGYGTDSGITNILDKLTIHIVPVVNVDGYEYTHTNDRMWRKTRSKRAGTLCYGVDPNRNCDAGFGGPGSSAAPCSDIYHGPAYDSESEVKAVTDFIRSRTAAGQLKAYITFHAYGQMILFPYSYTYAHAATHDYLNGYAEAAFNAVKTPYRTRYIYGAGAETIYEAAGGSDDFAYDTGVPLSYTIELRDKGVNGFVLPPDQIGEVCTETFNMMRVFENAAIDA